MLVGPDPENPRENKYRLAVISDIVTPFTASELSERQQAVGQAASDVGSDMEASDSNSDEDAGHSKGKKRSGSGGKKVQQMQTDLAREKKRRAFQPYRFEGGEICDIMLDVRVGNAAKLVPLTEISNSMFTRVGASSHG